MNSRRVDTLIDRRPNGSRSLSLLLLHGIMFGHLSALPLGDRILLPFFVLSVLGNPSLADAHLLDFGDPRELIVGLVL